MANKTNIVATIGPASQSLKVLTTMVKNGMKIARLNFSHGSYQNHAVLIKNIRAVSKKTKVPVLIMQDLQGPKIRVQELKNPLKVKAKQTVVIGKDFYLDAEVSKSLKVGQRILIQDGLIAMKVQKILDSKIFCLVENSGLIQSHKGVNFPDTKLKLPTLTQKDLKDLAWGLKKRVDLVAISFVRTAEDIKLAKRKIKQFKPKNLATPKVVAKIEKPEAIKNINQIIKLSDLIMIARGDLGVEMPEEQVPIIQNDIIKRCRKAKKPVIVATQMLESMVQSPRPTRAEVSDVADAVLDGASFVMLSEESAFGKYPVEAVKEMEKIITFTEKSKNKN